MIELMTLLTELAEREGSDLHLVVGQPPVFRVDGALVRRESEPLDEASMTALLRPHLTNDQWETLTQQRQDLEKTLRQGKRLYRFHVFQERGRLGAAIRSVPHGVPTLDLLYPEHSAGVNATFRALSELPRGLILVTGPSGCGKTTTCFAMLEHINQTAARRILTLEDPLNFEMESKQSVITQRSIGEDVGSFAQGAYWALHEDPDVIFYKEMRTLESVQDVISLTESGHLVFTQLHCEDAAQAIERIIEVFPSGSQLTIRRSLARNLQAVIAQQLIPRSDRPGRVAANEILLATPHVRQRIEAGDMNFTPVIEANRAQGMQTMDDSIESLYRAGVLNYETASYRLLNKERLGPPPA